MNRNGSTVLILSSDPAFARKVTGNWPTASEAPEFIALKEDLCHELRRDVFDLAIADAPAGPKRETLTAVLAAIGKPAILIGSNPPHSGAASRRLWDRGPVALLTARVRGLGNRGGPAGAGDSSPRPGRVPRPRRGAPAQCGGSRGDARPLYGGNEAQRQQRANFRSGQRRIAAARGPDCRPGSWPKADTIRNMALRLHEIFQRFSSIQKELSAVARESDKEAVAHAAANAS